MYTLQFTIEQSKDGWTVFTKAHKNGLPLFDDSKGRALCTTDTYEQALNSAKQSIIEHNNCTKINPYKDRVNFKAVLS